MSKFAKATISAAVERTESALQFDSFSPEWLAETIRQACEMAYMKGYVDGTNAHRVSPSMAFTKGLGFEDES